MESRRYVRYAARNRVGFGVLSDDHIQVVTGDVFSGTAMLTGERVPVAEAKLLAPCQPSKIIAVGLNYASHLGQRARPTEPGIFVKLPSSIAGPGDDILHPTDATDLHYEGEMVLVIGKRAHRLAPNDVADHVFGVTAGNDVSERVWQRGDLQWFRAKCSDTFAPIGPCMATGMDYSNLQLQTRLNGETVQSQRTADFIFPVEEMIAYITRYVTLEPGDLVFTGTPGTTRAMKVGDVVEVELEGVGILSNTVAEDN